MSTFKRGVVTAPSPADWGLDVTIAMAAITREQYIVAVSDRMISFGDIFPGLDQALKGHAIGRDWGMFFAANDANLFRPYSSILMDSIPDLDAAHTVEDVKKLAQNAYQHLFDAEF